MSAFDTDDDIYSSYTDRAASEYDESPVLGPWGGRRASKARSRNSAFDRFHFSAISPPSPFSPSKAARLPRPSAPTPTTVPTTQDWHSDSDDSTAVTPSSAYVVPSPPSMNVGAALQSPASPAVLAYAADDEDHHRTESAYSRVSGRGTSVAGLPDPSQFPDPYPYRPSPRWHVGTPVLSSADSSSVSTRSSAYTGSAKSGDYGHVHIALGEEDRVGLGITSDDVVQRLNQASKNSSAQSGRKPIEQGRWSDYSTNVRSRSSSVGNTRAKSAHEKTMPTLKATPSFDMAWHPVEERDEGGDASDEDTDEYPSFDDDEEDDHLEEPTSAARIADEGLGVIVRADEVPVSRLQVGPGTTHLMIGSSSTPNSIPSFLANVLPQICNTLLALDVSANFLSALPPALSNCVHLEELNIASNPLRVLPVWLSNLDSLRVLIVDATGISTLPSSLASLESLHTFSIRRNKMHSLPSWLCVLPVLETLLVDGNPFQGPWKALMEPLISRNIPTTPAFPPSTPMFPPPSASIQSTMTSTDGDETPEPVTDGERQEEDHTITSPRPNPLARSITAPPSHSNVLHSPGLTRTRTTPNRAYHEKSRTERTPPVSPGEAGPSTDGASLGVDDREPRRMKSAGELRRTFHGATTKSATSSPQPRQALTTYVTSASSSNLLSSQDTSPPPKRFASLGVNSGIASPSKNKFRRTVDSTLFASNEEEEETVPPLPDKFPGMPMSQDPPRIRGKDGKDEKHGRWGFLKKMSMNNMKRDQPPPPPRMAAPYAGRMAPGQGKTLPTIDVRISTTGALLHGQEPQAPDKGLFGPSLSRKGSSELLKSVPPPVKTNIDSAKLGPATLLAPPTPSGPTSRANKRRSFLPIDVSPIPIPAASAFVPGITATNSSDDPDDASATIPSPVHQETYEEIQRREEERTKEARMRALRSVMSYLRDMHDLAQTQQQTLSMYGGTSPEVPSGVRSRRPTLVDNGRLPSEISMTSSPRPDSVVGSRTFVGRNGSPQTDSVATTDSTGSANEERKHKDDGSKRARVIREIVETERTYVKGLQELVDIYIKPASAPVTSISGGQKDTVVPPQERKIVFGGLESLFSFHKESFLPSLERATSTLLNAKPGSSVDEGGLLSLDTARDVANTFVSHAAFMKMYSTYINNFDNSVQRVKSWLTEKAPPTLSPSSSTAQLASMSMAMSGMATAAMAENAASNTAQLTSSQRKRVKAYLKRCRMNPRHSQLNLEGYLLLPVQRIPRYRLLLEELVRSSPRLYEYMDDPIERALAEIASLATNMNEGKRESESRSRLVQWQTRIRGKFPSPLVQPHRRLIMDGRLHLTRVVRKATVAFEVIDSKGDVSSVEVECLSPELTPRSLLGILCNDLLVLCRDSSDGQDPNNLVDLWAVLRMQTLPQPASIVHGNVLRLVDNKAILYFDIPAPSAPDALTWCRAINLHIPASKG